MNKRIGLICIAMLMILLFKYLPRTIDRFSYSENLIYYTIPPNKDSCLTIGLIGDSWVSNHRLDSLLHRELLEKGYESKIISSGHEGGNTKLVYQNMFKEDGQEYSSKFVIENQPDYCIVIAGTNDASTQMGGGFYAHHITQIVKTLLHYHIKPVLVSCPEFGIIERTHKMNFWSKTRCHISAILNNHGEIDNIRSYRKKLAEELVSESLQDSIISFDFDKVCSDFGACKVLYSSLTHLSRIGNEVLSQEITNELVKDISTHRRNKY